MHHIWLVSCQQFDNITYILPGQQTVGPSLVVVLIASKFFNELHKPSTVVVYCSMTALLNHSIILNIMPPILLSRNKYSLVNTSFCPAKGCENVCICVCLVRRQSQSKLSHSLVVMAIFQVDLGKPIPECLHAGFYQSYGRCRWW